MIKARLWDDFAFSTGNKALWNELLDKSAADPVFGNFAWAMLWWKFLSGSHDRLRVIRIIKDEKIIGLAPMFLTTAKWGPLNARVIAQAGFATGEYVDLLLPDPDCAHVLLERLLDFDDWDVCSLNRLPNVSSTLPKIKTAAKKLGLWVLAEPEQACPFLELKDGYEPFMGKRFSSKFRSRIRRMTRHLQKMGEHRFEIIRDPASVDAVFEKIINLEKISWKGREGKGLFTDPAKQKFFYEIAMTLAHSKCCAIHLQWLDNRLLSYHFGFIAQNQYYDYSLAFDPEFGKYSPGLLSLADLLNQCFDAGLSRLDFLRGAENYKALWTNTASQNINLHVFSGNFRSKAMATGLSCRLAARMAKRRIFPRPEEAVFDIV